MSRPIVRPLLLLATTALLIFTASSAFASGDHKNTNKKSTENPKKPATAKDSGEADKIRTDNRMSTRGLKPPPKDADKDKTAKPQAKSTSSSDSNNPK